MFLGIRKCADTALGSDPGVTRAVESLAYPDVLSNLKQTAMKEALQVLGS